MMYRTELVEGITVENVTEKINAKIEEMEKESYRLVMILSILVDTFISKISFPMQPGPEIGSISDA